MKKLRANYISSYVITALDNFGPYCSGPRRHERPARAFLIVPNHPALSGLGGRLKEFASQLQISELFTQSFGVTSPEVTVSWRLAGKHLVQTLKRR